jgi:predicted N-acetyltransferase YhbS
MRECLSRGGSGWGAFAGERLVGIAVLDGRRIGSDLDSLDLYFLHVSNGHRCRGIGRELVHLVCQRAREMGGLRLYVSATPSLSTVTFYRSMGFDLASQVDPELHALEPDDIHMDMTL